MKKYSFIYSIICALVINSTCYGQNRSTIITEKKSPLDTSMANNSVDELPHYPGGKKNLNFSINYPSTAREKGIQGIIWVVFLVDTTGKILDARILNGIGGGCDEEALRVVKSMPNWIPARLNGKNTSFEYKLPIKFSLK